ncbi:hypothetical protein [Azospirillum sp. Sh1]|uniref:hypothetical protein n=1 Tax=Azospirillum sp. Sh1 TaxID=2607285 RepID=UPI0011EBC948|nr:hypothetical protein [Azospirillum sp. Sh1]KAA0576691.1 hypothetical protein FZ029_12555 [Azospirillum sp. Sh1]
MDSLPLPLPDVPATLNSIGGLHPYAQVAAVLALGAVLAIWIWSRRPLPGPSMETFKLVIAGMHEQTRATIQLSENVERVIEQNAEILKRLPVSTLDRVGAQ